MRIFAIDAGNVVSGYALLDDNRVVESGVLDNDLLLEKLDTLQDVDRLALEMIASYGMAVGATTFETCVAIGRFIERWRMSKGLPYTLIYRSDVKLNLCGTKRAKDANIRQALIDRLGGQGTKKNQGATYGVKSHAWSALAVAVTCKDMMQ